MSHTLTILEPLFHDVIFDEPTDFVGRWDDSLYVKGSIRVHPPKTMITLELAIYHDAEHTKPASTEFKLQEQLVIKWNNLPPRKRYRTFSAVA